MWLLNTFTCDNQWNNEDKFTSLYNTCHDEHSQRKLILALGRSHKHSWFRSKRRYITQLNPWVKRAFLAACSCLPGDQAKHWYRSIPSLMIFTTWKSYVLFPLIDIMDMGND
jgi:hypothetical protein